MGSIKAEIKQSGSVKLIGSTLMESLVAMFLLVFLSSLVFVSLSRINRAANVGLRVRAAYTVNDLFYLSLYEKDATSFRYDYSNFYVVRTSQIHDRAEKIRLLQVRAFDKQGRILARKRRLVVDSLFVSEEEGEVWYE